MISIFRFYKKYLIQKPPKKKDGDISDMGVKLFGATILFVASRYVIDLLAYVTRYYPFSEFFTTKPFHANWIGAQKIINLVNFTAFCFNNRFNGEQVYRGSYCFQIFGRFERKPKAIIFEKILELSKGKGLDITYSGEMEDGKHKFVAPIDQNWGVIQY